MNAHTLLALLALALPTNEELAVKRQARIDGEQRERKALVAGLKDGWKSTEVKPFLVLSHGRESLAREIATDAALLWKWLDTTFAYVGPDEHARVPILRMCASESEAEELGFVEGGWTYVGEHVYQITLPPEAWAQSNVMRRVAETWFQERDRDLYFALPGWFRAGLAEMCADARSKGGKVIFKPDTTSENDLARAMREDKILRMPHLFKKTMPRSASMLGEGKDQHFSPSPEAGALMRYLLTGQGAKHPKTKTLLADYVGAVSALLPELRTEVDAALAAESVSAADPAYAEKRAREFERLESRVLRDVFDKVFTDWTEKSWNDLYEGYLYAR